MPGRAKRGDTPTTGPDWNDLGTVMRALEHTHSATLVLKVETDGSSYSGSVRVVAEATIPRLIGPAQCQRFSRSSVWPSNRAKTFEGLVYGLLLALDHKIGTEGYEQAQMTFSPLEQS